MNREGLSKLLEMIEQRELMESIDPSQGLARINQWLEDRPDFFKMEQKASYHALIAVIIKNDTAVAGCLIDHGANVRASPIDGWDDLLTYALRTKKADMAEFLIDQGVEIHSKNNENRSPLVWACLSDMTTIMSYLIEKGVSINDCNALGETALIQAANYGQLNAVKTLVEIGADLEIKNKNNENALEVAQKRNLKHPGRSWALIVQYLTPRHAALKEKKELQSITDPIDSSGSGCSKESLEVSDISSSRAEGRRL